MTSSNTLLGTAGYVAPERLTGGGVTAAGDLYALGIVAWECLTGHPPFRGTPLEVVVAHRDQPLPPLPASLPADVTALVTELTAKDPAARPAHAGDVAARAARLRDRLARASGVSVSPLAGPWSQADRADPSSPVGVSTVPSSEVDLLKRAFNPPSPPVSTEHSALPEQPASTEPPVSTEPSAARRRPRWVWLGLGAAAAAVVATGLTVTQLSGAGPLAQHPPGSAGHRSPAAAATPGTGGQHPGQSPAGRPSTGAAGGPGAGIAPQASPGPTGTAARPATVTGTQPAATASASPAPSATASTGNGKGKGKAKGNGKGNGQGNGKGNGNGPGNG
jgi:serine/threonine-protein kinase